jgi:hypothetical protein
MKTKTNPNRIFSYVLFGLVAVLLVVYVIREMDKPQAVHEHNTYDHEHRHVTRDPQPMVDSGEVLKFPELGITAYYKDFPPDGLSKGVEFEHVFTRLEYVTKNQAILEASHCQGAEVEALFAGYDNFNKRMTFKLCMWEFLHEPARDWFIENYGRDWNTSNYWHESDL